ncbi:hypothetical protein, partial [Agrobacterium tumefaciens]|uniref:hypothetical protein n=1 Tax=Agrobacterium tumefaciens TaxID=358 RepID=UPI003BA18A86
MPVTNAMCTSGASLNASHRWRIIAPLAATFSASLSRRVQVQKNTCVIASPLNACVVAFASSRSAFTG